MSFYQEVFRNWSWDDVFGQLKKITSSDVEQALNRAGRGRPQDFLALVSPQALPYLEDMARMSQSLTRKRFGNTVQIYVPIYLSNHCKNICTYCGFSYNNKMERLVLNREEVKKEIAAIKTMGIDSVLILTGEDNQVANSDYLKEMISLFKESFSYVSLEVQPLLEEEYQKLRGVGLDAVLVYQETYHQDNYKLYHPKGKKSNFIKRLDTMDSLGKTNIHKMGLGVLLGLEDWRVDSFFCALHLSYLKKKYWKTRYSVSFPRLRPAQGVRGEDYRQVDEKSLAQLIFAYRLWDEDLELSLSTRETDYFRNHTIRLGITSISAGSKTNPGGYACYPNNSLEQFEISDSRTPQEMIHFLNSQGIDVIKKDWSKVFSPAKSS